MKTIENCAITQSNTTVLQTYCDDINDPQYKKNKNKFSSCVKLSADKIYASTKGDIIEIGNQDGTISITLRLDDTHYIKLGNVSKCEVNINDVVQRGTPLGTVDKYVKVEYLTNEKSRWQVRVGPNDFYKNNPSSVIDNTLELIEDNYALETQMLSDYRKFFTGDSCPASSFIDRPKGY